MTTPELDQYYPGGVTKQALDWNEVEHAKAQPPSAAPLIDQPDRINVGIGPTIPSPHGPSGYLFIGNIIFNWGIADSTNQGVTVKFGQAYQDGPPNLVVGSSDKNAYVSAVTTTEVTITGKGLVHWQAIGT